MGLKRTPDREQAWTVEDIESDDTLEPAEISRSRFYNVHWTDQFGRKPRYSTAKIDKEGFLKVLSGNSWHYLDERMRVESLDLVD